MLDSGVAELDKFAAFDIGLQPAAEREGAGLGVEETPGLAGLGVEGDVQAVQQVFGGPRFAQLCGAGVLYGRGAIGLFVDLVDDAVANRHRVTSGWCRPP